MKLRLNEKKFTKLKTEEKKPKDYTILIVDDEKGNLTSITGILEEHYNLLTASDGQQALDLVKSLKNPEAVQVIISDQRMPKMSGVEFLKATIPIIPKAIRIILTGYTDADALIYSINEAKIYKYLTKPVDAHSLLLTVQLALEVFEYEGKTEDLNQQLQEMVDTLEKKVSERTFELETLNRQKDKFFSIIGHDLKAPFIAMLGLFEVFEEDMEIFSKEEIIKFTQHIHKSGRNVFKLLENLLEWSRLQMGKMEFHPQPLNLKILVDANVELLRSSAEQKEITLINEVGKVAVSLDKNMIHTVLRNLMNNAIKFTNRKGNIHLSVKEEKDFVILSVQDNGLGIRENVMEKLFRIDRKYTSPGTEEEAGTGLGLNLCKEMINKHGGRIWVESEFGKGSTFSFSLPKRS